MVPVADQLIRGHSLLDPPFQRRENIVLGIAGPGRPAVAEPVGTGAAATVPHRRHHEQAIEVLGGPRTGRPAVRILPEKGADALVILDRAGRGNRGIAPAVILNQFAPGGPKRAQVRAGGVQDRARLRVAERDVAIEVQRPEVPLRILEDRRRIVAVAKPRLNRGGRVRRRDPRRPAAGKRLGAGRLSADKSAPWCVGSAVRRKSS